MKATKLLAVLLISLVLLGKAEATITTGQTFAGTTTATNASSLSFTVTAPDLTDGKYHYFVVGIGNTGLCTMTSGAGYSWSSYDIGTTNATISQLMVGRIFSGAGTTVTVTASAAQAISAIGIEVKSDAPLRLDRVASGTASSASPSTGATQTTSTAAEICFASLSHRVTTAGSATTSGTLTSGHAYKITTFVSGDNFTNVGALSNATGVFFIATGTTPTTWANGSTLTDMAGTYASPTNSYSEVATGGISTINNTSNNDRECDLLYKTLSATGTTTAGATVTGSNNNAAIVATFEEVSVTAAGRIPSVGN